MMVTLRRRVHKADECGRKRRDVALYPDRHLGWPSSVQGVDSGMIGRRQRLQAHHTHGTTENTVHTAFAPVCKSNLRCDSLRVQAIRGLKPEVLLDAGKPGRLSTLEEMWIGECSEVSVRPGFQLPTS
jgi:hypothetical protein